MNKNNLAEISDVAANLIQVCSSLLTDRPYGGKDATVGSTVEHLGVVQKCLDYRVQHFISAYKAEAEHPQEDDNLYYAQFSSPRRRLP